MNLDDKELEFAFSGSEFINIGKDINPILEAASYTIILKGIYKAKDENGANSIVAKLHVSNTKSSEIWLCSSFLLNDSDDFIDSFTCILPKQEQEIDIIIEDYDIAYSKNRRARLFFVLEDGRRRILGHIVSICIDYNIFSGRYQYQKHDFNRKNQKQGYRELDIKVNKLKQRRYISNDWTYMYFRKTLPIVIANCTGRDRSFIIEMLEIDGEIPDEIVGMDDLSDAIDVAGWGTNSLNILVSEGYIPDEAQLDFNFRDLATDNRYVNSYTYNSESDICKINYSLVFYHNMFFYYD